MISIPRTKIFWQRLFLILQGVPVLYLMVFLIFYGTVNYRDVVDKARVAALNRLMPSLDPMVVFITRGRPLKRESLNDYLMYYQAFNEIGPGRADVYGMMGFCYYYLGYDDKAIASYEQAAIFNPHFFWFYYNLATIYFKQGKYQKAIEYSQLAIDSDRETAVSFLNVSKPYADLVRLIENRYEFINNNYRQAQRQCFEMLIVSHYHLKEYPEILRIAKIAIEQTGARLDFFNFYSGLAAFELKQYPYALSYLHECMKINERYSEAFYYFALSHKALGRDALADQAMRIYTSLKASKAPDRPALDNIKVRIF